MKDDYYMLNKLLQWYVDYNGSVPVPPNIAAKNGELDIERRTAFLMCAMMRDDGYLYKINDSSKGYNANYKAKLFLDEGGYVSLRRAMKRKKAATWMVETFDFLKYPLGIIITLLVLYEAFKLIIKEHIP